MKVNGLYSYRSLTLNETLKSYFSQTRLCFKNNIQKLVAKFADDIANHIQKLYLLYSALY